MYQINFHFESEESATNFFEWWKDKIQPQFLKATKHDDQDKGEG